MTKVSELLAEQIKSTILKTENISLKMANIELQHGQLKQLRDAAVHEQETLIEKAREEVGVSKNHVYDPNESIFKEPDGPRPLKAPEKRQRKRVA